MKKIKLIFIVLSLLLVCNGVMSSIITQSLAPGFTNVFQKVSVKAGENAEFHFGFFGDPMPDIQIYYENILLVMDGKKYSIASEGGNNRVFTIYNVTEEDAGKYSVRISNMYGEAKSSALLSVEKLLDE